MRGWRWKPTAAAVGLSDWGIASRSTIRTSSATAAKKASVWASRLQLPARPAPWRPEIDDHGQIATLHHLIEVGVAQLDRLPVEQCLAATPADRVITQARRGDSIHGRAMRAGDVGGQRAHVEHIGPP